MKKTLYKLQIKNDFVSFFCPSADIEKIRHACEAFPSLGNVPRSHSSRTAALLRGQWQFPLQSVPSQSSTSLLYSFLTVKTIDSTVLSSNRHKHLDIINYVHRQTV